MSRHSFTLPSFAKINLGLRVLGKRPDGYHEIKTVLQTISLHDELHFATSGGTEIALYCDDPQLPTDSNNLIVRAAHILRKRFGIRSAATIRLEKRIPVQGGLGGGSSNAAAALLGLSKLWAVDPHPIELNEMAESLGADVPFFLSGGRALAIGTGTDITPLPDMTAEHLMIIAPRATVSTAAAYQALRAPALTTMVSVPILAISRTEADFADSNQWPVCEQLANDFEQVIFDIEPEIRRAKNALIQAGARNALLAGSGSSVFGIFDSVEAQRLALTELRAESGWRIFSCLTLSRVEYARALGAAALGRFTEGC